MCFWIRREAMEFRAASRRDAALAGQRHQGSDVYCGGSQGVSRNFQPVKKRWRLSRLTLTHEMARVVLLEQLYRAYTIIHGLPYQK